MPLTVLFFSSSRQGVKGRVVARVGELLTSRPLTHGLKRRNDPREGQFRLVVSTVIGKFSEWVEGRTRMGVTLHSSLLNNLIMHNSSTAILDDSSFSFLTKSFSTKFSQD